MFVPNLEDGVFIGPHAENGGDAVGGVGFQVLLDIFRGEELFVLIEADGCAQVNMQVDDARHHVLALQIDNLRRRRSFQLCRRPYPLDTAVVHDHGGMGHGVVASAVNQGKVLENFDFCNQRSCKQKQQAGETPFQFVLASSRILLARDGLKIPQEQKRER